MLETLLLLSVYEERNHRLFSSLLEFSAMGGLGSLLHISAHKEHHYRIRKDTEKTALLIPLAMLNGFVISVIRNKHFCSLSAFISFSIRCTTNISYQAGLSVFWGRGRPPVRISTCRWHSQCIVKAFSSRNGKQSWCLIQTNQTLSWNEMKQKRKLAHTLSPWCSPTPAKTHGVVFWGSFLFFSFFLFWVVNILMQGGACHLCLWEMLLSDLWSCFQGFWAT